MTPAYFDEHDIVLMSVDANRNLTVTWLEAASPCHRISHARIAPRPSRNNADPRTFSRHVNAFLLKLIAVSHCHSGISGTGPRQRSPSLPAETKKPPVMRREGVLVPMFMMQLIH